MEGLTSPAKELSTGSGSTIHPTARKGNSAQLNFRFTAFYEVGSIEEGRDSSFQSPGLLRLSSQSLG
jgi:hypothetical protein